MAGLSTTCLIMYIAHQTHLRAWRWLHLGRIAWKVLVSNMKDGNVLTGPKVWPTLAHPVTVHSHVEDVSTGLREHPGGISGRYLETSKLFLVHLRSFSFLFPIICIPQRFGHLLCTKNMILRYVKHDLYFQMSFLGGQGVSNELEWEAVTSYNSHMLWI